MTGYMPNAVKRYGTRQICLFSHAEDLCLRAMKRGIGKDRGRMRKLGALVILAVCLATMTGCAMLHPVGYKSAAQEKREQSHPE